MPLAVAKLKHREIEVAIGAPIDRYGEVGEVRRRYSLPEVRVHARGPLPHVPAAARITDEGEGSWRILLSDGTPPHEVLIQIR